MAAPDGLLRLRRGIATAIRERMVPLPKLVVSEWADRYRRLSRESSAEPGQWRTDRAPYQRGMLDAFADPGIERIVIMSSAQIGKTEILNTLVGFFMSQDPAPILVLQPTLEMAEAWSKDRLAPMLRDTPSLRQLVADPRSRLSGNTLLHKEFPGGRLTIAGANSPASLASRPIRIVLADEVDRYPFSAGTEGDPVSLAFKRTANFWNRKLLLTSTPTLKGLSRIEQAWEESDQRRFFVPCPDCGHRQVLIWGNLKYEGLPEPRYACAGCGSLLPEESKPGMLAAGEWVAGKPGTRAAGFHVNALYSPWARWPDLVADWIEAQSSPTQLQAFINLALGEVWEERGSALDPAALEARREKYNAEVPAGVGLLTAGVDVQDDRIELVVRGWGKGEESWLIAHEALFGDPGSPPVWADLDARLSRMYQHEGGAAMRIAAAGIDTQGHHTDMAYRFCKPRYGQRVYAMKGSPTSGAPLAPRRPTINNKGGVRLFVVGTEAAKDLIYARLKIKLPGPLYLHFPETTSSDYFGQLVAERVVRRQVNGRWFRRYELPRGIRNEALDCEVYALAALALLGAARDRLERFVERVESKAKAPEPATSTPEPSPSPAQQARRSLPRRKPGGFVRNW